MATPSSGYDYDNLYKVFADMLQSKVNLTMIDLNDKGVQPSAPFVAFDIISPYLPLNWLEDDGANAFEAVVSFTVYGRTKVSALNAAERWRNQLKSFRTHIELSDANIVLVEIMQTQIRSVAETTQSAFMVGFDVRLRLQEPFEDSDVDTIENIEIGKGESE
jgi:hypothetical protein